MSIRIAGQVVASAGSLTAHNHDAEAHPEIRALIEQGGGSSGSADVAKAVENKNEADNATQPIYHWIGTKAEHEAQNIATEHPEWLAYITDDDGTSGGGGSVSVLPATEEQAGVVFLASQEEALEAFDDSKAMTPLKTAQKVYESVGRVIQLGFDGTLSGNILTFEPDTDTPYEIKNGYSYEIDLLFPAVVADGKLDENIEMAINNNGESIKIVNALHDNTATNITVGKMKQIMKYTNDIGFRWIFNARFTTTQAGEKVFVMPSTVVNVESPGSGSAEIPDNVYTSDNLIAGKNVTFTEVPPEGGIDEHTLACWHCDEGTIDAVSSLELWNGAKTSSSYYKFGVASVYNVTGPILNIANSLSASSDWTIDFWAKPSSNTVIVLGRGTYSSSYQGFSGANAKIYNNRVHVYRGYSSSGQEISLSRDSSTFTHYAFQRKSEYLEFFVNGQKIIQQDVAGAGTDGNFGISLEVNTATCYFDEIRISDTARYTEDFTPPTKAYTVATGPSKTAIDVDLPEIDIPEGIYTQTNLLGGKDIEIVPEPVEGGIDEYTLGVFHCETSSYDTNAVEGGGSLKGSTFSTKTEYFKFGESSLYAGNSYPYYYMSTSQIKEESDWTVDGWIRLTEWPGTKASAGCGQSGSSFSWKVEISHDNNEAYIYYQNNSSITKTSSYTIPANEWLHFAAEKDGNTINGYANGVKIISYTDDSVKNTTSKRYPFLQVYEAYFDEIRFSNTARYKGQPFTPPTKAYSVAEPTGNMVVNYVGESLQEGADYVAERYDDEQGNWYEVWKSGRLRQGGALYSSSSANSSFVFLKPFADDKYTIVTGVNATDNYTKSVQLNTLTETGFYYKIATDGGTLTSQWCYYMAEGKGA